MYLSGLGLNLILSQIVFNGGTNTPFDAEPLKYNSFAMAETFLFEISYTHPLTTNIVYILITAIFAGVLGSDWKLRWQYLYTKERWYMR